MFAKKYCRLLVATCLLVLVFLIVSGSSYSAGEDQSEKLSSIKLTIASRGATDYFLGDLADIAEKISEGRITFDRYPGGALGDQAEVLAQTLIGTINMCIASTEVSQIEEKLLVFELPFIIKDSDHAKRIFSGEIGEQLAELMTPHGIRILGFGENGYRHITNNVRPIYIPEDVKGLKLRIPGGKVRAAIFETLKADTASIPGSEVFSAITQGVVDGQENPFSVIDYNKIYEVNKYLSLTGHVYSPFYALINEKKWQELDKETQTILRAAAVEAGLKTFERNTSDNNKLLEKFKEQGVEVNEVDYDAFVEAVQPVYEMFADTIGLDLIQAIRDEAN